MKLETKDVTLLGVFSALAVVGRIGCSGFLNITPVSFLFMLITMLYGWKQASLSVVVVVLVTSVYLGFGVWVPLQIFLWIILCLLTNILFNLKRSIFWLSVLGFVFGYFYGAIMDVTTLIYVPNYLSVWVSGLLYDTSHAVTNAVLMLVLGKVLYRICSQHVSNRKYK